MTIRETIAEGVKEAVQKTYATALDTVELQATKKEFEGDLTVVVFPMLRYVKDHPERIGKIIGDHLVGR
ncbi:MAG: arginine--tRNA ligase, partial [Sinomicrobium sp.]|nr:arginine--tRNA ligase [Sinomicrobium sp.]